MVPCLPSSVLSAAGVGDAGVEDVKMDVKVFLRHETS